ncbi:MAG: ABC transporter permease [Blastocatellales bacterium]
MMQSFWQDLRYGARLLLKKPGFTLTAIVTLALGIGANTAIFSVVNAVLLRPLPYPEPERLIATRSNESALDLADIRTWNQSFENVGGTVKQPLDFTSGNEPLQWQVGMVTGGFFRTLGVQPLTGRFITDEDDKQGGARVVVLSYELWQKQFGGQSEIVGKEVSLSGHQNTVIGVMPAGFKSPRDNEIAWCPLQVTNPLAANYRGVHFLRTYMRLKEGVTIDQARSEMQAIDKRLAESFPEENKTRRTILFPLKERIVGATRQPLLILFGAVALVLLIACANYANLLLARAATREQEMVVRMALGAGRWRVIRQWLTESVLLSVLGGAAGLLIAQWGIELLLAFKPADLPRLETINLDWRVLGFTLGISVITGLVFGLAPAWQASHASISQTLKEGGRGMAGSARHRLRGGLVVIEMAMALVLLIGAGLLIRSFWQLRDVKPGFNPAGVLTLRLDLPEARYEEEEKQTRFRLALIEDINSLPDTQAAMISELPMTDDYLTHNFEVEGKPATNPGEEPEVMTRSVAGDYFRVMQIPLLAGRDFTPQDRTGTPLVGIINQALAKQFFPTESPIGKRVRWARDEQPMWITIVGIAADIKHFGLDQPDEPALYSPYAQVNRQWKRWMSVVVRSGLDEQTLAQSVRQKVWKLDGQLPITKLSMLDEVLKESFAARQFNLVLLGFFAVVALLMAMIGIYGVMTYAVTQRTHEIGVRIALGAQTGDVLRLMVGQGMRLALAGVTLGLLGAFALTRLMASLLFGISTTDPLTFLAISMLLAAVALFACWLPARRATKVDPMVALRYE